MRTRLRSTLAGVSTMALLSFPLASASAASEITSQPYVSIMGLDDLRKKGLDGEGITIAVIDGPVDTTVPELRGADITTKDFCKEKHTSEDVAHGTAVMSLLASPRYGWAPKAKFLHYTIGSGMPDCRPDSVADWHGDEPFQINQALNDGADIISLSIVGGAGPTYGFAVYRAALRGVPVVVGMGNGGADAKASSARVNGTIGVVSGDLTGRVSTFSTRGVGATIMAVGEKVAMRRPDANGRLTRIQRDAEGTSLATPMVTGALALAMQAWPQANGNQLTRSMINTAVRTGDQWSSAFGWGALNAATLATTDPTGLETTNPLLTKNPRGIPSPQDMADYDDGLASTSITSGNGNTEYIYRGNDPIEANRVPEQSAPGTSPRYATPTPTPSHSATTAAPPTGAGAIDPALLAGGGVGILALAGLGIVLVLRRRHSTPPTPPRPPPAGPPAANPNGEHP